MCVVSHHKHAYITFYTSKVQNHMKITIEHFEKTCVTLKWTRSQTHCIFFFKKKLSNTLYDCHQFFLIKFLF